MYDIVISLLVEALNADNVFIRIYFQNSLLLRPGSPMKMATFQGPKRTIYIQEFR